MRKSTARSRLKVYLIIGLCLPVGAILFFWLLAMPNISALRTTNPTVTALMEARQALAKAQGHTVERHWTWVPLSRISPDLRQELSEVVFPFTSEEPTDSELRIAQAQLVGWLEGLFHGIQATLFTQQAMAQGQIEEMRRRRALEPGAMGMPAQGGPSGYL